MSRSVLLCRVAVEALPVLEVSTWREQLLARVQQGSRLLTLYGRRGAGDEVTLTTALCSPGGELELMRARTTVAAGYHELTRVLPAFHCFERELHEQTGLRLSGHPWLKPLRYEAKVQKGQAQEAMADYPFYTIAGKEVHEVQVGPVHAGVIEPGAFRFLCHGEQVHHLEIQLGYQHRGVEARLLTGDPRRLSPLVETIAGDTSVAHTWAYASAIESLTGTELELGTEVARAVALELERVGMHLASLAGLAADIGFLQGATSYGRLRTTAINTTMRLCGSRFGRGALRPGGIQMQLSGEASREIRSNLQRLGADLALINECFLAAHTVRHRLQGVGILDFDQAAQLGVVGMVARASGVAIDTRQHGVGGAYKAIPLQTCLFREGDAWARAALRIAELDASLSWLEQALALHANWNPGLKPVAALLPSQLVVAVVEGWRGEVVHCLETDAACNLAHYKVQDPSLRNWMGLALAVRNNEISDFPICNKSFDLSYCGNDL